MPPNTITLCVFFLAVTIVMALYFIERRLDRVAENYSKLMQLLGKLENTHMQYKERFLENSLKLITTPPQIQKRVNIASNDITDSQLNTRNRFYEEIIPIRAPKCDYNYELIILVQSTYLHFNQRMAIRNTWGQYSMSDIKNCKTFFITTRPRQAKAGKDFFLLRREYDQFEDIIIGNTTGDIYELSLKLQMAFLWSVKNCQYKYLLKADDDIFVNIPLLLDFVNESQTPKESLFAGNVQYEAIVERDGRYGVPMKEYKKDIYPRYCSGGGFVLSFDVVAKMCKQFDKVAPLRMDDAYVGELALSSGVDTFQDDRFQFIVNDCEFHSDMIVHHPVKSRSCMQSIFEKAIGNQTKN